jgi:selenocysteine lyase/cysteine desulfurase
MSKLEKYFSKFRENIIGIDTIYHSPYGTQKIVYCDWIASGRLYGPIEEKITNSFGPFVANTHTEASETGTLMTLSYKHAHELIKNHVNAGPNDALITAGFGMTAVVNKLQRIMGLKKCEGEKPVVFLSHMEHHSNHTSWYETHTDVVLLEPDKNLLIDLDELRRQLEKYKDRECKIGAFTACSNVTGIETPYHEMAKIMHEYDGLCFIDFAASAPYVNIDMHPTDPMMKLDAIYFSPHKFLGGPGSSGVLVFDKHIYKSIVPDNPGGGTVDWTNRWGGYQYIEDIEVREDGGTPGFLQSIRAGLAIKLKEKMDVEKMRAREKEIVSLAFSELRKIPGIYILADNMEERLGIISFYHSSIHFNLIVRLLSDHFGIQVRGGCVCAGTYGHYLLEVSYEKSKAITDKINHGDLSEKPGWVRWSLHPTTLDNEIHYFIESLKSIISNISNWKKDYVYLIHSNEFIHESYVDNPPELYKEWFSFGNTFSKPPGK